MHRKNAYLGSQIHFHPWIWCQINVVPMQFRNKAEPRRCPIMTIKGDKMLPADMPSILLKILKQWRNWIKFTPPWLFTHENTPLTNGRGVARFGDIHGLGGLWGLEPRAHACELLGTPSPDQSCNFCIGPFCWHFSGESGGGRWERERVL